MVGRAGALGVGSGWQSLSCWGQVGKQPGSWAVQPAGQCSWLDCLGSESQALQGHLQGGVTSWRMGERWLCTEGGARSHGNHSVVQTPVLITLGSLKVFSII